MNVGNANDFVAGLVQKFRGHRTDVAEPLHDDARIHAQHAEFGERPVAVDEHAAPGGFVPPARSAEVDGLAGHDGSLRVPHVHRIGIHDPGHGLFVRAEIGRGHVALRAEPFDEFSSIAARDAFQLAVG